MASKGNTDEKVVQLMLDSKEFDSNAKKSIQTLDDLKKAFEFEGASKGFEEIEKAAKKVDLSIMENGIQKVQDHFNLLNTVATTALERITNKAIDTGVALVKSLSTDQIMSGWSKFEDKTTAVQTIMSATSQQFTDTGEQMEFVEGQLERLNWFTDETSFKFLDMVNNIGKFTSNSVDLDVSVKAMQGISTWAARSGANVDEAGRAMYNLSQAIAVGAVKLQDWKSIENANMATAEFKQTAIETAEAMGTLVKVADGVWWTLDNEAVTVKNFNENLSKGWFTSEVLLQTLSKYGDFATKLGDLVSETGVQTTVMIGYIDDYIDGTINMEAAIADTGLSVEELTAWLDLLSSEEYKLGRESFKAAQETKTLSEAIDYVKEAVSSGWMRTFEYIFGNYTEAKEFWSKLAESMYDVFVAAGDARNEVLAVWKALGGRDIFIKGLKELGKNVIDIFDSLGEAWENIFGKTFDEQVEDLLNLTDKFYIFAQSIRFTGSTMTSLQRILSSIFRIMRTGYTVVTTIAKAFKPLIDTLNVIGGLFLELIADITEFISFKFDNIFNVQRLQRVADVIKTIGTVISVFLVRGVAALIDAIDMVGGYISMAYNIFEQYTGGFEAIFLKAANAVWQFWNAFEAGETFLNPIIDLILTVLGGGVGAIIELVVDFADAISGKNVEGSTVFQVATEGFEGIKEAFEKLDLESKLSWFIEAFSVLSQYLREFFQDLMDVDSELRQTLNIFGGELQEWYGWLKRIVMEMSAEDIAKIGMLIAIMQLILGINNLTKASAQFVKAGQGIATTINGILTSFKNGEAESLMSRITAVFSKTRILQIGIAVTMMAAAFNQINKLDYATTVRSLILLTAALGIFLILFKKWDEISTAAASHAEAIDRGSVGTFVLQIGAAFLAMSIALKTVTDALDGVENSGEALAKIVPAVIGLSAMAAVLLAMASALQNVNPNNLVGVGAGMVMIATGVTLLAIPVNVLAQMDWKKMAQGIISVSALLITLGISAKLMSQTDWKTLMASGVAMTVMSGALLLLSASIFAMGNMNTDVLIKGIASLAGVIVILSVSLGALGAILASAGCSPQLIMSIAAAFGIFTTALIGLTVAAMAFSMVPWEALGKMAATMGTVIGIFAALVALLTVLYTGGIGIIVIDIMKDLSSAILNLGLSMLAIGAGATLFALAINMIQFGIVGLGAIMTAFGDDWAAVLDKGLAAFGYMLNGIIDLAIQMAPKIVLAIGTIIALIKAADWYNNLENDTAKKVLNIAMAIISVISTLGKPIAEALIALLQVLNTYLPDLFHEASIFIRNFVSGIGILLHEAFAGIVDLIIYAVFGERLGKVIIDAMSGNTYKATEAAADELIQGTNDNLVPAAEYSAKKTGAAFDQELGASMDPDRPYDVTYHATEELADNLEKGTDDNLIPAAEASAEDSGDTWSGTFKDTTVSGIVSAKDDIKTAMYDVVGSSLDEVLSSFDLSSDGLFSFSGLSGRNKVNTVGGDYSRYDDQASEEAKARAQAVYDKYKDAAKEKEDDFFSIGEDLGSSLGSGVGSGASSSAKKEAEKTAEEIVQEYASALSDAYSKGSDYLDIRDSQLEMEERLWAVNHKEGTTDAEKEAYELAKKQFEIDKLNAQMEYKLDDLALLNAQYIDKLNLYGSGASETAEAFNSLISGRLELLELYNEKMDLLTEEVEHDPEAFIAASKEIGEWRELVEQGFITNEQMMEAAKDKISKVVGAQQHQFDNTNTMLDQKLEALSEGTETLADLAGETWDQLTSDALKNAVDSLEEGSEDLAWSTTDVVSRALQKVITDGEVFGAAEGLGVNINDGTINGLDVTKGTLFGEAKDISQETLDTMEETLGINSPSKYTIEMGEQLDNGLIKGIANRQAAVIEQAIKTAVAALKAAKDALGVRSPSRETYDIGNNFDKGLANGIANNSELITKSIYGMVDNLLDTTNSQLDQNGSEVSNYLKDMFDLPDEDTHLRVVIDTDRSSLDDSMSLLEKAYALNADVSAGTPRFATVNAMPALDDYGGTGLQDIYDLINSYVDFQKEQAAKKEDSEDQKPTVTNVSFTQNNTSPKAISATDTYRNTRNQLNQFVSKVYHRSK